MLEQMPVQNDGLRKHTPLIMWLIFLALILNFIIFIIYLKSNQDLSALLKVCDPIKICHPGGY